MYRLKSNLVSGLLFMSVAAVVWFLIPRQIAIPANGTVITDPSFFPKVFTVALFIVGTVIVVVSALFHKEVLIQVDTTKQLHMLIYLGMLIVFGILMNIVGFLIASIIFGTGSLIFFRCRKKSYYVITALAAIIVFIGFKYLLNIDLP